ncbi:BTB/POZ domain-containing protein [Heracleum sosnowskyi]|uniref:BTB/POZ domain-containing protein n=1 Tax=Heracleum sosnowskyi TaxID=360622 RepID=A0AAD8HBE0_9APIA|nr:BTB/POZ domain-containing protein [Heracleum sosnowskyi]
MATDKPSSKGQAWFCTTGLPSDVAIEVDDMTFHLHKFPLMSKSRKLHQLITEEENNPTTTRLQKLGDDEDNNDERRSEIVEEEEDQEYCNIILPDFPGGSDTFEIAAKFCYGVKIELTTLNVAPLRCAAEFLEMTDEYSEDNLISKTERFLSQSVLKSLKDSIKTLKSCKMIMPQAEKLGIVNRCLDSVAKRASTTDPSLFGWPVNEPASGSHSESGTARRRTTNTWFDELGDLSLPLFKRLISAMRTRDHTSPDLIESCLIAYAKKYIPGISRSNWKQSSSTSLPPSQDEQRELLETIISNLPREKRLASSTSAIKFLFGLLRTANILNIAEIYRDALEKKIGSQLEQATLDDLLVPSYSYLNETLYDVDCVERILGYFLDELETTITQNEDEQDNDSIRSSELMLVGKLIDGYLSEIASDANLKQEKFYKFAVTLPHQARLFDDGLYRAVDVYLKAHPWLSEAEREKISGVMDCEKLTLEACTHAAQNERLPLRAIVQVLFFEQLQLRHAIVEISPARGRLRNTNNRDEDEGRTVTWRETVRENEVMRVDMDSMRTRVQELERECSTMKKAIEKIPEGGSGKRSFARKFGCKFKTQVCDSHQSSAVDTRRARNNRHRS